MSQYSLLPFLITFVLIYHPVKTLCFLVRSQFFAPNGICMTGLKYFNVMPGFRWYPSPDANTTYILHHNDAAGSCLRLDLGLNAWARDVKFVKVNVLSQHRPVPQPLTRKTLFTSLTVSCFLETFWRDYCISPLLRSKSIVNEFISKHTLLRRRANCVTVTICQHRSTVVWVDCAKMTCCIGFSFLFISLSIYMLLYKQRGLWRRVMKHWR